tara:strand:+ start:937 stop:1869 length:933 start_codon:yes stop_codon:yes gene_type:complete
MATTSTTVQELYTDIVAELALYFADATLIDNPQFMTNKFDIQGSSGNTVRVPITNTWTDAGVVAAQGDSIIAAGNSILDPGEVDVTMTKYGVGSNVREEALEDGGYNVVRNNLLIRLAGGLGQAVDIAGLQALVNAGGDSDVNQDGDASLTGATYRVNAVCGPTSLAMATKRAPSVKMFYDVDSDTHQFRASTRVGFNTLWNGANAASGYGVRKLTDHNTVGSATLTLADFSKSVANLRAGNFPTMQNGLYSAFIIPSTEFSVASQLNSVGTAAIGSLSGIGNRALLTGLIGQAAGCEFYRSNNMPQPAA